MMNDKGRALRIQVKVNRLLYKQLYFALWTESLTAIGLVFALWGAVNPRLLIGWLLFRLVICGVGRATLLYSYRKSDKSAYSAQNANNAGLWLNLFTIGAFLSGINWGAVGSLLMVQNDLVRQTFAIILLIGVTAAANPLNSPSRRVYAVFLFSAMLPFFTWLMLQGGLYNILAVMALVYMAVMLATSYYSCALILNSLKLRFKNSELMLNLSKAKRAVEKRTVELEKSYSLVRATLESTSDGVLVLDPENRIEDFNKKFVSMWNIKTDDLDNNINNLIDIISDQLADPSAFRRMFTELQNNSHAEIIDEVICKDGKILERYSHPQIICDKFTGRVWRFRDVSERKLLEQKLLHQANYDSLTGLPNRTLVFERIRQAVMNSKRESSFIAILYLDLDGFKIINDTLGHKHGDLFLKEVANRLVKCVQPKDTVSREGGDEFIVILNSLKNENEVNAIADKILGLISEPFVIDNNRYATSISIGVSLYPKDGDEADRLIRNADIAMYRAKELGKNNFQFFTAEMNEKIKTRLMIENQLRDALDKKQFSLMYQPIASLRSGKITCVEALLYWNHPRWGQIHAIDFLPVAEETGMIIAINNWVLRTACAQLTEWMQGEIEPIQICVNLSPRQFRQENFIEQMGDLIKEKNISPDSLALEITENVLIDNVEKSIQTLNTLREMGIIVVIDDFGVGYSSMKHLKDFPAHKLKISSHFIRDISNHASTGGITSAIIALAGKLNLKVIAEGVENENQLKFLIQHHCDEVQGFYFSPPLSREACTNMLFKEAKLSLTSENN